MESNNAEPTDPAARGDGPGGTLAKVGERLATSLRFSPSQIAQFATLSGDHNPIHHDLESARSAQFENVVVSGPQLSSRLMGMTATHFSNAGGNRAQRSMLGLEFRFRFRRPAYADTPLQFSWEVVAVRAKPSLGGELVFLAGRVCNSDGEDAVKAVGKVLVRPALA